MALPDRTPPSSVPAELPEAQGLVRALRSNEPSQTLTSKLVPVADNIRQLYTLFGLRPYRVFIVHWQWSGDRIGDGTPVEISRREILPTPRVRDMNSTNLVLHVTGNTEEGGVTIDQISPKYSEDDLMGRTLDMQDPALMRTSRDTVEFFWEIQENRSIQPYAVKRRYVPTGVPMISRDGFQWTVPMTRQDHDEGRQGAVEPRNAF